MRNQLFRINDEKHDVYISLNHIVSVSVDPNGGAIVTLATGKEYKLDKTTFDFMRRSYADYLTGFMQN